MIPASLVDLAGRYGVATEFEDWTGRRTTVAQTTLVSVLAALGVSADTEEDRAAAVTAHEQEYWQRPLPPIVLARSGATASFWVHVSHCEAVEVAVRLEDGTLRTGLRQLENNRPPYDLAGRAIGEASFEVPADLPLGYHRVEAQCGAVRAETLLVVSPATLEPPARLGARRSWGLATQLYSVRSRHSWGIGDLTDLADLAVWSAARHRAGFVLVNPLHAAAPTPPMEPSPYLPTSRRYLNPVYLRVEAIPEFAGVRGRNRIRKARDAVQDRAARADLIDRDAVWQAKRAALAEVYEVPWSAGRQLAYAAYCAREGAGLDAFATWCALAEEYGNDWHAWPKRYRHPHSAAVTQFATDHAAAVDFHRWLQFTLDEQLAATQATALRAGMDLGVMSDLAVGVDPDGADAWALQDVLALGVTAGAPPDEFNQLGQDWSQPPWRPDQLVAQAYAPFRAMVNAVLRHAGGVRIDHIIGLFRLWWIPRGAAPTEGTYVRYDHEAMIGIVALEAHRAGAVVVGEDLGTVEPWVREHLRDRGLFGTSILWFEMDRTTPGAPRPLPAEQWRAACLSSVTTHDLPPTAGYLAGEHVRLRAELGLLTRPAADELADDRAHQAAWRAELRRVGLLDDDAGVEETVLALHRYLGRTPSRLLALSLVDAVGDVRTQNQPGTSDEYPNWRIPLRGPQGASVLLEDVFTDARAARLADAMAELVGPPL